MFNYFHKIFMTVILCLGTYAFADVQLTREVLSHYSSNNPKVLESYDRVTKSWAEYKASHQEQFDFEKLLKAVEFAAEKHEGQVREDAETPYIISPIGISDLLWNVGSIRNVNILTSALLQDTLESTNATEDEIATLFGPRVLYIVKEVTNDPTLTNEENDLLKLLMMSSDGQLIKLAEGLYNVKDLYPMPTGWTEEKIEGSYMWAEKLLSEFRGTNSGFENSLQTQIEEYRNKINGQHAVANYKRTYRETDDFWGDAYFTNDCTRHGAVLDNGTVWWIDYQLYQRKNLSLYGKGEEVEIKPLGNNNRYLMIIRENDGTSIKSILFTKNDSKTFVATWESNRISIIGSHTVTNLSPNGFHGEITFNFADDDRVWGIQGYIYDKKKISIENGDEVEVSALSENRYLVTFPAKGGGFIFRKDYGTDNYLTWDVDHR